MHQWRVRDVMTHHLVTARDDATLDELVAILSSHRISAVAVVDRFDAVVGVVSRADLLDAMRVADPRSTHHRGWLRRHVTARARPAGGTARDVMSAPPITIGHDAPLAAAGRLMYCHTVKRLLVTGADGHLQGVITAADLLKIYSRLDCAIRDDVAEHVLRRTLRIGPDQVQAHVEEGVVTLNGRLARRTSTAIAVALAQAVPGVVSVVNQLEYGIDDTISAPPAP
jgi:CBS domain-containing protein